MAFSKGSESVESSVVKRYVGFAPVYVLAVNPNKAKIQELMGYEPENAPEYVGKSTVNDKEVPQARIDFIVKTAESVTDNPNEVDMTTRLTFFVRKAYRFNKDQSKVQVIDKYGRTCWVTKEQLQNHEIPMYSNGPANVDKDYRPCYIGEEDLTNFIKAYLAIPNVMKYVDKTWVMVDDPQNSEARLENVDAFFQGNFKELEEAVALQPNNKVKVLFGVRTTDDNKQYQTFYNQTFLINSAREASMMRIGKELEERKASGAYPTTEFEICKIKEYVVAPTDLTSAPASTGLPFDAPSETPWG